MPCTAYHIFDVIELLRAWQPEWQNVQNKQALNNELKSWTSDKVIASIIIKYYCNTVLQQLVSVKLSVEERVFQNPKLLSVTFVTITIVTVTTIVTSIVTSNS